MLTGSRQREWEGGKTEKKGRGDQELRDGAEREEIVRNKKAQKGDNFLP